MSAKQYIDMPDLTVYHEELMQYLSEQGMADAVILEATLSSGSSSVTFTDLNITSDARFDIYASKFDLYMTNMVVSGNTLTVTFDSAPSSDVLITLVVNSVHGIVPGGTDLGDLADVTIDPLTLADGQGLIYSSTYGWINGEISAVGALNDLTDVTIATPQEGDMLVYEENNNELTVVNKPKSLYPSAPITSWADYKQLVDNDEDDPDAEYYIDDIDVAEAYYVETSGQTALTGATSLTFTNSHIKPTADIRILAEPASCKVSTNPQYKVLAKLSSVGNGTATITFPALAENTEFWLLIECPLAITQNDETKADKVDLASINVVGSTNTTGSTISAETYFYLNGLLVRAKADIATNATFTLNTNYKVVTAGALNNLRTDLSAVISALSAVTSAGPFNGWNGLNVYYYKCNHVVTVMILGTVSNTVANQAVATATQFNNWGITPPQNWILTGWDYNLHKQGILWYVDGYMTYAMADGSSLAQNSSPRFIVTYVTTQ